MSRRKRNKKNKEKIQCSPIKNLINVWSQKESSRFSGESNHLTCLSEYLEKEHTLLWGRDPDPMYEQCRAEQPKAGVYADIGRDLNSSRKFIRETVLKHVRSNAYPIGYTNQLLRLLCSIPDCCASVLMFDKCSSSVKEELYSTLLDWAMSDEWPRNVYCTFILGEIYKADDEVMFWWDGAYKKLIGVTLARLKTLNGSFLRQLVKNCPPSIGSRSYFDESFNLNDSTLPKVFGEWTLAPPMTESMQARLLIVFLRHVAGFVKMLPSIYSGGVLVEMSVWLCYEGHKDIRLTFDALRLLYKLLQRGVIYTEFIDPINWIDMLVCVPRPSVAANIVSFCLKRLLSHDELVDEVVILSHEKLENLIHFLLWVIQSCHPSAQSNAMSCLMYLIYRPHTLRIFEDLNGPSHIINVLRLPQDVLNISRCVEGLGESRDLTLLSSTLMAMNAYLEQSLLGWSTSFGTADRSGLFTFPSVNKNPFSTGVLKAMPLAMKLQSWSNPCISDSNILKVIFSTNKFLSDPRSNQNDFPIMLDILSLLFLSNQFALDFQHLGSEADTFWRSILAEIKNRRSLVKNLNNLRSVLCFLSILCCRPLQDIRTNIYPCTSARKRRFSEMEGLSPNDNVSVKVESCTPQSLITNKDLQTKLWDLIRGYDIIPGLLNVMDLALSHFYDQSESIWICTWICHVLSGLSRSGQFSFILRKYPIFKRGYLESRLIESAVPDKMTEYAELCSISLRLFEELPVPDKVTKPASIFRYLTKRELESTPHSHNNRMVRRCVRQSFDPHVQFHEKDVIPHDAFTQHFCFAKSLDEGLFFVTLNQEIIFIALDGSKATVHHGQIFNPPSNLENTKDGKSLMVSSRGKDDWNKLTLFDVENRVYSPTSMKKRHEYPFSGYAELSKSNDEKYVVSGKNHFDVIDVETGAAVFHGFGEHSEMSGKNRATFSYDDNFVLSCASLWDLRCSSSDGAMVHQFDCSRNVRSWTFHPNQHDVIIGNTVWDMRTHRLIQTIPSLDSSKITFVNQGDFFYSYNRDLGHRRNVVECYDSRNYTSVMSHIIRGSVFGLAVDPTDSYVAVLAHYYFGKSDYGRQCSLFNVDLYWKEDSMPSSPVYDQESQDSFNDSGYAHQFESGLDTDMPSSYDYVSNLSDSASDSESDSESDSVSDSIDDTL